jgi:hypothetical protein
LRRSSGASLSYVEAEVGGSMEAGAGAAPWESAAWAPHEEAGAEADALLEWMLKPEEEEPRPLTPSPGEGSMEEGGNAPGGGLRCAAPPGRAGI